MGYRLGVHQTAKFEFVSCKVGGCSSGLVGVLVVLVVRVVQLVVAGLSPRGPRGPARRAT